jgi:hypothetical protein
MYILGLNYHCTTKAHEELPKRHMITVPSVLIADLKTHRLPRYPCVLYVAPHLVPLNISLDRSSTTHCFPFSPHTIVERCEYAQP